MLHSERMNLINAVETNKHHHARALLGSVSATVADGHWWLTVTVAEVRSLSLLISCRFCVPDFTVWSLYDNENLRFLFMKFDI
jgi:hypothetical protein